MGDGGPSSEYEVALDTSSTLLTLINIDVIKKKERK
jgi:hypothetical protein